MQVRCKNKPAVKTFVYVKHLCYEFESFPQNVNTKNIEISVNYVKENKIDYKHKNCALLLGA